MHTTVDAVHRRAPRRPTCSSRSRRSTATRRGCAWSTASSRSSPTTAARRGGSSCGPASGRSPGRSSCGWCARVYEPDRRVRFERIQDDDRDHAEWILTATVDEVDGGATLVTELTYTGKLWGIGVLQRVLDDEIRRGKDALRELVSAEPTR